MKKRKRRKWNEENIKKVLVRLYNEGILTISYLYDNYGGMVRAIDEDYGSIESAFEKFGIPYDEINKLERWTKEKIIMELQKFYGEGVLTTTYLKEKEPKLFSACKEHFGSLKNALKACGIRYEDVRQTKTWTSKGEVDDLLLELYFKGVLTPTYVKSYKDGCLIGACKKFYGSLETAVEANGISYQDITMRKSWDREKLIGILRRMNNQGESLQSVTLKTNYPQVHAACVRQFGSYEKAITIAGFSVDEIYGTERWNKDRIFSKLQDLGVEGILQTENFAIEHRALYKACYREFGSFMEACEKAGLDVHKIKKDRPYMDKKMWERDEVLNDLYEWFFVKRKSHRALFEENGKLEKQARVHFGTLLNALKEIDLEYEKRWKANVRSAGLRFENVVGEVLEELKYPILYKNKLIKVADHSIKPDYVLEGDIFIDAKISCWTQSIEGTIDKYKPYCEELWIVYWFNNSERTNSSKLKFKSINEFLEQLPEDRKAHYDKKLNDLETWLNEGLVDQDISRLP